MIDPSDITKFDRTDAELEEWWLFSVVVAGKTSTTQARLLDAFLKCLPGRTPFGKLKLAIKRDILRQSLIDSRLGQYNRLERCFTESLSLNLRNDPLEKFEAIHGVGPKTARMFLMHSRPSQNFAALDTHILKHLRDEGFDAPAATPPPGERYRTLEHAFITLAKKARMSVAAYDLHVWKSYAT
jgi:hypothetical protein